MEDVKTPETTAGNNAAGGESPDLDDFLGEEAQPRPDAAGQSAPGGAEPDEYDLLKPGGAEQAGEGEAPEEPDAPAAADVDGVRLVLPKGVSADNPELASFVALTKEISVPPEAAQKLVDLYAEKRRGMVDELVRADRRFRETLDRRWIRENRADPEFGGANYDRSCNYAAAALRKFIPRDELMATAEKDGRMGFLEFFTQANIRNSPQMFRFLARVGRHVAEAAPMTSEAMPPPNERSIADTLFEDVC